MSVIAILRQLTPAREKDSAVPLIVLPVSFAEPPCWNDLDR
jgi:hypothetical protein